MYLLIYLLVEKYKKFIDYLPPVEIRVPVDMIGGGKKIVPDFVLADVFRAVYPSSWSLRSCMTPIPLSIASRSNSLSVNSSDTFASSSAINDSTSYGSI